MRRKPGALWQTCVLLLSAIMSITITSAFAAEVKPTVGSFLVASERMADPRFRQSVVLLVQHGAEGSGGVIVNRPSRLPLNELFPGDDSYDLLGGYLHYGGPVAPDTLLVLARLPEAASHESEQLFDDIYLSGLPDLVEWLQKGLEQPVYRVFKGYAGWAPGQLAAEMARGDWRVLPADAESIFEKDGQELWGRLSRTQLL